MSVLGRFHSKRDRRHYLQGRYMNISLSSRIAITACFAFAATGASAATLDFSIPSGGFTVDTFDNVVGSDASGAINFLGVHGEAGVDSIRLDVNGLDIDVTINDVLSGNPYFDADSGGPGGLGSCRVLTATAQCDPNSDDNLTIAADESLRMDFTNNAGTSINVLFGDFLFYNDNHDAITGTIRVTHGANIMSTINVVGGIGDLSGLGASTFLLFNDEDDVTKASTNYYITAANVSAVPVPAAVWLMGSALGLLGWRSRKAS
jgi:hypothetical protein